MKTVKRNRIVGFWGAMLVCSLSLLGMSGCAALSAGAGDEAIAYVTKVDHAVVSPDDPEKFFSFLVDELRLARSWNWGVWGGYGSGGAFAGNMNIESTSFRQGESRGGNSFLGLAFEPAMKTERLAGLLEEKGIPHGMPMPFWGQQGLLKVKMWTSMDVGGLIPGSIVFTCDYEPALANTPKNIAARKATLAEKQKQGPGILEVAEIRIACGADSMELWGRFLCDTAPAEGGVRRLAGGPSLRIIESATPSLEAIRFRVASLASARIWLEQRGMLGEEGAGFVRIAPDKSYGIALEFCE